MSSSTKIELPLHAWTHQMSKVIARLVGAPCAPDTIARTQMGWRGEKNRIYKPAFDSSLPASLQNPWRVEFEKDFEPRATATSSDMNYLSGRIEFKDAAGQLHSWFFCPETPDSEADCKSILPDSHALAVAVGERLVRFFGGRMVANDGHDEAQVLRRNPSRALMPPRKPGQTGDDRWYQFENALWQMTPLSAADIRSAAGASCYGMTERCMVLAAALDARELRNKLADGLDSKLPDAKRLRL